MASYTFLNLQTRVAAEINDSSNADVSLAQVKAAIVSAIEHYERERKWFSESRTSLKVTVAGFAAVAPPTYIASSQSDTVYIDQIQMAATTLIAATVTNGSSALTACSSTAFSVGQYVVGTGVPNNTIIKSIDSSTQMTMGDVYGASVTATASDPSVVIYSQTKQTLEPMSWEAYSKVQYTASGQPTQYCYYQDRLWLYPTPNARYGLLISYIGRLATLSADGDNNGWTNYAEPVIRNRAKWDLFLNYLRMPKLAQVAKLQEMDALEELNLEHVQRNSMGRLKSRYL